MTMGGRCAPRGRKVMRALAATTPRACAKTGSSSSARISGRSMINWLMRASVAAMAS